MSDLTPHWLFPVEAELYFPCVEWFSIMEYYIFKRFYLFFKRWEGKKKERERNIDV